MKSKGVNKTNTPVMILLILGLSTIIFPLYMAIVIAFKQPSEMTNDIAGILSPAQELEFFQLRGGYGGDGFLAFSGQQPHDHSYKPLFSV